MPHAKGRAPIEGWHVPRLYASLRGGGGRGGGGGYGGNRGSKKPRHLPPGYRAQGLALAALLPRRPEGLSYCYNSAATNPRDSRAVLLCTAVERFGATRGGLQAVRALLAKGCDVNVQDH